LVKISAAAIPFATGQGMTVGQIAVEFTSSSDIQWAFVAHFATKFLRRTQKGWNGVYSAKVKDTTTGQVVRVVMKLIPGQAVSAQECP